MFCRECGRKIDSDRCPYCGEDNKAQDEPREIQQSIEVQESAEQIVPMPTAQEGAGKPEYTKSGIAQPNQEGDPKDNAAWGGQWTNENSAFSYSYQTQGRESTCSRSVAALLQIFLGAFGVGRFYMGYIGIGIAQIMVTLVTCGIGGLIWGFVDGVLILSGTPARDANGNMLKN